MKKYTISLLVTALLFLATAGNVSAADLNLTVSPSTLSTGEELMIRFSDIGADHYLLIASCKDGVSVSGKARPDICGDSEKVYPTGKDTILVRDFYPTGPNTSFYLEVAAVSNGEVVSRDSVYVAIKSNSVTDQYSELNLSVAPDPLIRGGEAIIRFNDVAADYYLLSATCKDSVHFGGKARNDLCVKGEKIYPTGKDTIQVRDFYPQISGNSTSVRIEVSAIVDGDVVKSDVVMVSINPGTQVSGSVQPKPATQPLTNQEKLDLVEGIFGKDSDLYKIVQMLITLGII